MRDWLSDAHKLAIGDIITAWASLEEDEREALMYLLRTKRVSVAILVVNTFWQHRIVLETLAKVAPMSVGKEKAATLKPIISEIRRLAKERDRVAHSTWWGSNLAFGPSSLKPKRGTTDEEWKRRVTVESLRETAGSIRAVSLSLRKWMEANL
jgi:hypothetical protein